MGSGERWPSARGPLSPARLRGSPVVNRRPGLRLPRGRRLGQRGRGRAAAPGHVTVRGARGSHLLAGGPGARAQRRPPRHALRGHSSAPASAARGAPNRCTAAERGEQDCGSALPLPFPAAGVGAGVRVRAAATPLPQRPRRASPRPAEGRAALAAASAARPRLLDSPDDEPGGERARGAPGGRGQPPPPRESVSRARSRAGQAESTAGVPPSQEHALQVLLADLSRLFVNPAGGASRYRGGVEIAPCKPAGGRGCAPRPRAPVRPHRGVPAPLHHCPAGLWEAKKVQLSRAA